MADSKTLEGMINKLRFKTSVSGRKALVVIDAGIATEENLAMIKAKGYDYLCVSRSNLKSYKTEAGVATVTVTDNRKQKIDLCHVKSGRNTDYYLKVESQAKEANERSMNQQFRTRHEARLQNIAGSLTPLAQNIHNEVIVIRRCSEPNPQVRKIYVAIKYKYAPFNKKKSVVHKSEFLDCQFIEHRSFLSG